MDHQNENFSSALLDAARTAGMIRRTKVCRPTGRQKLWYDRECVEGRLTLSDTLRECESANWKEPEKILYLKCKNNYRSL